MSKGKGEIRHRLKNGSLDSGVSERVRIRRNRKKESHSYMELYKTHLMAAFLFISFVGFVGYIGYQYYHYYKINLVRQPINLPKIIDSNSSDKTLFWGTYRPQLFFGMKHRSPASLLAGLMWFTQSGKAQQPNIRYWCNNEKLNNFGWQLHDLRNFGLQTIHDSRQTITTAFVKNSGDWMVRINVESKNDVATSLIWYLHMPNTVRGYARPVIENSRLSGIHGSTSDIGDFKLTFHFNMSGTSRKYHTSYLISHVPREDRILQTIEAGIGIGNAHRMLGLIGTATLPRTLQENIWAFELTGYGNFTLDVLFKVDEQSTDSADVLSSDTFQTVFDKHAIQFHDKFQSVFNIEGQDSFSVKFIDLAKAALSNLIGGIGYFYGSSLVKSPWETKDNQPLVYWPTSLMTATPSRTVFPRGFLWDEGFHELLLARWDPVLALEIIGYWLDILNSEGWIPREQILGWESRAKVPEEFIIQDSQNGNPPTLVLCLEDIDSRYDFLDSESKNIYKTFLKKALPRLEAWFNWFNQTQLGIGFGNYQWKGRSLNNPRHLNPLTLTSGLDDYPRASHPSNEERHVDLRCWITMFSGVLAKLRKRIDLNQEPFLSFHLMLMDEHSLNLAHWNDDTEAYSDFGLHTESVSLFRPPPVETQNPHQFIQQDKIRKVHEEPKFSFIPHFGYVNLFPMLLKILPPTSVKLGKLLSDLENPNLLWTKYGLRSLALNSSFYQKPNSEHDPPYWRGAIWINMNYLAIRSLRHYSSLDGPYRAKAAELSQRLRHNVVTNVLSQMKQTGYMWEQYDDSTGKGQRAHPFSGWTSLVVLSMGNL